jgi:hypothetical protein
MQITHTTDAENQNLVTTVLGTSPTSDCFFFFEGKKIQNKTKLRVCSLASIMPSIEHIDDNLAGLFCGPEIHLLLCSSTTQEAVAAEATATEFERRKKLLACDACAVWKGNNNKISNKMHWTPPLPPAASPCNSLLIQQIRQKDTYLWS